MQCLGSWSVMVQVCFYCNRWKQRQCVGKLAAGWKSALSRGFYRIPDGHTKGPCVVVLIRTVERRWSSCRSRWPGSESSWGDTADQKVNAGGYRSCSGWPAASGPWRWVLGWRERTKRQVGSVRKDAGALIKYLHSFEACLSQADSSLDSGEGGPTASALTTVMLSVSTLAFDMPATPLALEGQLEFALSCRWIFWDKLV